MIDKNYLLELYATQPRFKGYIDAIRAQRPVVSSWTHEKKHEDWVYETGVRAGFDFAMAYFGEYK